MNRKCTDVICLLVFSLFCAAMFGIAGYGFANGNPSKLLAPLDADGHFCGYDDGYEDFPLLYYWSLSSDWANSSVCVSVCPNSTSTISCHNTTHVPDCNADGTYHYNTYDCTFKFILFSLF
jgi:hypothetical protein